LNCCRTEFITLRPTLRRQVVCHCWHKQWIFRTQRETL